MGFSILFGGVGFEKSTGLNIFAGFVSPVRILLSFIIRR